MGVAAFQLDVVDTAFVLMLQSNTTNAELILVRYSLQLVLVTSSVSNYLFNTGY